LRHFLEKRRELPSHHFVIGNEAGDADTIISAISLAYIESVKEDTQKTPIVSIPKADLKHRRPEVRLLLELAGISPKLLLFVDDPLIKDNSYGANITLVDHNVLAEDLENKGWKVLEIVDHHEDKQQYLDSCSGPARNIAFADDKALVASACTLVAERLKEDWPRRQQYPVSVGLLLLGVILLDSVNLDLEVGKVTQRDRDAVEDLLENTHWKDLPKRTRITLHMASTSRGPNPTVLFNVLQDAKYEPTFWESLSVQDALNMDYKDFPYGQSGKVFGVSTVLTSAHDFFKKQDVILSIRQYMENVGIDFLGIMFAFLEKDHLRRQLALCGTDKALIRDMVEFLLKADYEQENLDLKEMEGNVVRKDNPELILRLFTQQNVAPSRKQIGPILQQFFTEASDSENPMDSADF